MLISDEHNPFISSVNGHPMVRTPNMERLAERGTVFENSYCPSPLCLPARGAFMAGRRVHEIQAYSNSNVNLDPSFPSYGAVLREQGVHTVHIGKVDAYTDGEELGFSEMILPGDRKVPGDVNFKRKPLRIREGSAERAHGYGPREDAFSIEKDLTVMKEAVQWLETRSLYIGKPWVLSVNLVKPHFPHYVTPELWNMYSEGDLPEHGPEGESANHPYARDLRDHFETDQFTEEQVRGLRRGYLGCVTFIDRQLGRILEVLENTGQLENTNIIYTSDHGDMLGKFGMWWKCSLYEDSVRIPLIAAGPDFRKGLTIKTPVDLLDLQASFFKTFNAERPQEWTGVPLQDIPENNAERVVFSEYHGHGTHAGAYMVRKGSWKLIYYTEAPHQLFNLDKDPDELYNVYRKNLDKVKELEIDLKNICLPEREDKKAFKFQEKQLKVIREKYPEKYLE